MRPSSRCVVLLSAMVLSAPFVLPAQQTSAERRTDRLALADYLDWEDVQDPQVSPDGRQIVFTRRGIDKMNDRWEASLSIMHAHRTPARFLPNLATPPPSP